MAFVFDYFGVRYASPSAHDGFHTPATILLGTLTSGRVYRDDRVYLQLDDGTTFTTRVLQFYDDLYECTGMPFYDHVDAKLFPSPFALVLPDQPGNRNIMCPGRLVAFNAHLGTKAPPG